MNEFRHNNGVICWRTLRVARADFDADRTAEFQTEILDELCGNGNRIKELESRLAEAQSVNLTLSAMLTGAQDTISTAKQVITEAFDSALSLENALVDVEKILNGEKLE